MEIINSLDSSNIKGDSCSLQSTSFVSPSSSNSFKRHRKPISPLVYDKQNLVTAIKSALRDDQRVNIFIDQKFAFSLTLSQLLDAKIKVGTILNDVEITTLKELSDFGKLYQSTLEYILIKPRSIKEVRDYLEIRRRKKELELKKYLEYQKKLENPDFKQSELERAKLDKQFKQKTIKPKKPTYLISQANIDQVIEKLITNKYLDDQVFARLYLENRNQKKGISLKKLKTELFRKGITVDIIEELLSGEITRSDTTEIAKIISKKRQKYDDQKLIQYLVRQGFDFELAKTAVLETDSQSSAQNPSW